MKRRANALLLWMTTTVAQAQLFLPEGVISDPTPERFSVCHAHDCKEIETLGLSSGQWEQISAPLRPVTPTAAEERTRLGEAIARMEHVIGPLTGTEHDQGGSFSGLGAGGQMDCIDESVNTTTYLTLFQRAGLLRHHQIEPRATRGFFLFGWPHTSAVIRERGSDARFAVDSWFHDNGTAPEILPLDQWRSGYSP